jgi:hypothetical protein
MVPAEPAPSRGDQTRPRQDPAGRARSPTRPLRARFKHRGGAGRGHGKRRGGGGRGQQKLLEGTEETEDGVGTRKAQGRGTAWPGGGGWGYVKEGDREAQDQGGETKENRGGDPRDRSKKLREGTRSDTESPEKKGMGAGGLFHTAGLRVTGACPRGLSARREECGSLMGPMCGPLRLSGLPSREHLCP